MPLFQHFNIFVLGAIYGPVLHYQFQFPLDNKYCLVLDLRAIFMQVTVKKNDLCR